MIHPCPKQCESKFQDELYGRGRRVYNESKGPVHGAIYGRCTVCKHEDIVGRKAETKKEEVQSGNESKES